LKGDAARPEIPTLAFQAVHLEISEVLQQSQQRKEAASWALRGGPCPEGGTAAMASMFSKPRGQKMWLSMNE
jgi:hypothetical protein